LKGINGSDPLGLTPLHAVASMRRSGAK
jgi:hypothetical protein